jgi:hypothetical protein
MKKHYFFKVLLLMIPISAISLMSYSGGITGAYSGSPGDGGSSCTACHSGSANLGASASISTNIPSDGYELNTDYTITVNSTSSSSKLGFQLTAENGSNTKVGSFIAGSGTRVSGQRITQSTPSTSGDWSFTWKSPATNEGNVTFYTAVNATNGNGGTSGDQVVLANMSVGVLGISEARRLHFEMFPNPASENLTIQLPSGSKNASVVFYDYIGRTALTQKVSQTNNQINVQKLSSGVYIIKVLADGKIGTQKFVKK